MVRRRAGTAGGPDVVGIPGDRSFQVDRLGSDRSEPPDSGPVITLTDNLTYPRVCPYLSAVLSALPGGPTMSPARPEQGGFRVPQKHYRVLELNGTACSTSRVCFFAKTAVPVPGSTRPTAPAGGLRRRRRSRWWFHPGRTPGCQVDTEDRRDRREGRLEDSCGKGKGNSLRVLRSLTKRLTRPVVSLRRTLSVRVSCRP